MSAFPTVHIDLDGTSPDWMYVIVEHPTGIWYENQYGGTAVRLGRQQGYLVPVDGQAARPLLDALFLTDLAGTGMWGGTRRPGQDVLDRVAAAVALVRFWDSDRYAPEPHHLALDLTRAKEVDEAWVPVVTPDGPGILIWPNSD